jgi:hypothetical protein
LRGDEACIGDPSGRAYDIAIGRDFHAFKGVVAHSLHPEAAKVIVRWIESAGGVAGIDDGYHEE